MFVELVMNRYEKKRLFRVSTIHTASRMASQVLAVYEPYIEFGFVPLPVRFLYLIS